VRCPQFGLADDKGKDSHDREFRNNAITLVRCECTITKVARDLSVSKRSRWVRRAEEGQLLSERKTLALETPE
jgi:transposase-like protein